MDYDHLKSLVTGYTALPELVQALDLKSDPRQLTSLLDQELERKKQALRDLQAYRNFLGAPISVLPAEILAEIFYIYASETKSLFNLKWTLIMLVCQIWRNVGLSTASLWSCLDFENIGPNRLRAQLQRSKGWPLDVKASLYTSAHLWRFQHHRLLPLKPERLRSLNVHGSPTDVAPFLEQLVPSASAYPILRDLEIHLYSSEDMKHDAAPIALTEQIVSGGGPILSTLCLWQIAPPWRHIRGLTSLEVHATPVTCDTLVEVLSRCPDLRMLDVGLSPPVDTSQRNSITRVSLPSLQYLQLCPATAATCNYLLSSLSIPPPAFISLPTCMTFDEMRTSRICSTLRKHLHAGHAPSLRTLSLYVRETNDNWQIVNVNVFSYVNLDRYHLPDSYALNGDKTPCLTLCVAETTATQLRQAFASILDALPVRGITHINFGNGEALSKKVYKPVLALLPSLTTMTVRADTNALAAIETLDWFLMSKHRRTVAHLRLDCTSLAIVFGRNAEDQEHSLALARGAFHAALAHARMAKDIGQPLDVIELLGGRGDTGVDEVIDDMPYKEVYRLLAKGLVVEGYLSNKERAKSLGRWRRKMQRERGIDSGEWVPEDDSEVEVELDAEEAGAPAEEDGVKEETIGK